MRRLSSSLSRRAVASTPLMASSRALSSPGMSKLTDPTPEHAMLRESIAKFAKECVGPQAREADISMNFNHDLFKQLADLGALGITIPEEHGGAGMDATAAVIIMHELCKYDPGFCLAYLAHSMLFVNNFFFAANESQRKQYLPRVLSGEVMAGMGMSEPGAGTDVLAMTTTAKKVGDKYILNGGKTWITNGTTGEIFLIYAKVDGKVTAFIVERAFKGFSNGPKIDKCGMRGSQMCQLFFDNVEVPAENLIGEEGKGVVHMMRNLEIERVTLAGMAVGIADQCVEYMLQYAKERKAFGAPINQYGQIQKFIGESFAQTEAAKALTYLVAANTAPGTSNRIGSDAAKLFAAPVAKTVADNAMQVMGGMGYSRDMPIERLWRDAKLLEIGGGTNEAHHKNLVKDLSRLI
jgi:isovaleryl-CoA dehydrogenase